MRIIVEYYAALREASGFSREEVDTRAETPAALYRELQQRHGFRLDAGRLMVAINDEHQKPDALLRDGDLVVFLPPVSGG